MITTVCNENKSLPYSVPGTVLNTLLNGAIKFRNRTIFYNHGGKEDWWHSSVSYTEIQTSFPSSLTDIPNSPYPNAFIIFSILPSWAAHFGEFYHHIPKVLNVENRMSPTAFSFLLPVHSFSEMACKGSAFEKHTMLYKPLETDISSGL